MSLCVTNGCNVKRLCGPLLLLDEHVLAFCEEDLRSVSKCFREIWYDPECRSFSIHYRSAVTLGSVEV